MLGDLVRPIAVVVDPAHLVRVAVVVRQCGIHVHEIESVLVSDRLRRGPTVLDLPLDVTDRNPRAFDVGARRGDRSPNRERYP